MLPATWLPFVFPTSLRDDLTWIDQFGQTRRTYLLGFSQTSHAAGRAVSSAVHAGVSPRFSEDPRRCIPVEGWRDLFFDHGEIFEASGVYRAPPPNEPIHKRPSRWEAYGKDQPEHAWARRPMRLFEVIKSIAAIADALEQNQRTLNLCPSPDGTSHIAGNLSIHPALFTVGGFNTAYYDRHLSKRISLLTKLFEHCDLWVTLDGEDVPTFYEMSRGLSATYRTCLALKNFCASHKLPELGMIQADFSSRGTNRNHRRDVKKVTRTGVFDKYSADCAIEIFGR